MEQRRVALALRRLEAPPDRLLALRQRSYRRHCPTPAWLGRGAAAEGTEQQEAAARGAHLGETSGLPPKKN